MWCLKLALVSPGFHSSWTQELVFRERKQAEKLLQPKDALAFLGSSKILEHAQTKWLVKLEPELLPEAIEQLQKQQHQQQTPHNRGRARGGLYKLSFGAGSNTYFAGLSRVHTALTTLAPYRKGKAKVSKLKGDSRVTWLQFYT